MGYEFGSSKLINGVAWGVVSHNYYPDGAYQVRCKLPWIKSTDAGDDEDFLTTWCRVSSPMAGAGRGFYALPEVGDEVLLAFIHGNINQPVVVGCVWNDTDATPHGDAAPVDGTDPMGNPEGIADAATDSTDTTNNARFWLGRSGNSIVMDDTAGGERILVKTAGGLTMQVNDKDGMLALYDQGGETYLFLDVTNKKITLECKNGDMDILCKNGLLTIDAKNLKVHTTETSDFKADTTWKQESTKTMDLKAGGDMTQKAPKIKLN